MGEFSDWGGQGLPGDTDVAPAGAGGDPFGGAEDLDFGGDYGGGAEAASQGALPGGPDGQYSPFSPNGGVDATDLFGGGQQSTLANVLQLGPGGNILNWQGSGGTDNLGTSPAVQLRSDIKLRSDSSANSVGAIVRSVRQATGLRVTAKSIVGLIVRYGFPAAARLTGLAAQQLLQLFMREKGVRHHRRGPGIYTIARRLRAASRLQATVARVLGRGGGHHRRARRAPYHHFRKHRKKR